MVRINYQRTNKPMEDNDMKLTGILKDKVSKAETMEAKKNIIADAGSCTRYTKASTNKIWIWISAY